MEALSELAGQVSWLRLDLLGRLVLATALGGAIGFEREHSGKPAGLRTNILICVGATFLTDLSVAFPQFVPNEYVRADPARLAAQIVSGIGFLGAGTIIQARGSVTGLTTAATLWVVAAIGIGVGTGSYVEAAGATVLVLGVLVLLGRLEAQVLEHRSRRSFRLVLKGETGVVNRITELMEEGGLVVVCEGVDHDRDRDAWVATFEVRGPESVFRQVRTDLLDRDEVQGFNLV